MTCPKEPVPSWINGGVTCFGLVAGLVAYSHLLSITRDVMEQRDVTSYIWALAQLLIPVAGILGSLGMAKLIVRLPFYRTSKQARRYIVPVIAITGYVLLGIVLIVVIGLTFMGLAFVF